VRPKKGVWALCGGRRFEEAGSSLFIDEVVTNDRKLRPQVVASRSLIGYRQSHERCSLPSVPEWLLQRFSADCGEFAQAFRDDIARNPVSSSPAIFWQLVAATLDLF
jgi:hypothetical protein